MITIGIHEAKIRLSKFIPAVLAADESHLHLRFHEQPPCQASLHRDFAARTASGELAENFAMGAVVGEAAALRAREMGAAPADGTAFEEDNPAWLKNIVLRKAPQASASKPGP